MNWVGVTCFNCVYPSGRLASSPPNLAETHFHVPTSGLSAFPGSAAPVGAAGTTTPATSHTNHAACFAIGPPSTVLPGHAELVAAREPPPPGGGRQVGVRGRATTEPCRGSGPIVGPAAAAVNRKV